MRPTTKPVTDVHLDAPDGAVVDGYERVGAVWIDRLRPGSRWKRMTGPRRERDRIATVVRVSGPPWNIVEYRYISPLLDDGEYGYGHCRGKDRRANEHDLHERGELPQSVRAATGFHRARERLTAASR